MMFRNHVARARHLLAALFVIAPCAYAADEPAKKAIPSLSEILDASGVAVSGYVDTSYASSQIAGDNELFPSNNDDGQSFSLNQAALMIASQPKEGWGALVNVIGGQAAKILDAAEGSNPDNFNVTQAFIQYATGSLTIIGGKFVTLAGAEVISSPGDYAFSRSILFGYAIPYTHTGVRATYAVNDMLSLTLGANNGWNSESYDHATAELGATITPIKDVAIIVSSYIGDEPSTTGNSTRQLYDVVATWTATEWLTLILNYDWAKQDDGVAPSQAAEWSGYAGYALFSINDMWKVRLRGEYFDDKDGYETGFGAPGQKWKEFTGTLAYLPTKSVEFRLDLREDKSNEQFFTKTSSDNTKSDQFTYGIEALYKF